MKNWITFLALLGAMLAISDDARVRYQYALLANRARTAAWPDIMDQTQLIPKPNSSFEIDGAVVFQFPGPRLLVTQWGGPGEIGGPTHAASYRWVCLGNAELKFQEAIPYCEYRK